MDNECRRGKNKLIGGCQPNEIRIRPDTISICHDGKKIEIPSKGKPFLPSKISSVEDVDELTNRIMDEVRDKTGLDPDTDEDDEIYGLIHSSIKRTSGVQ